MSNLSRAAGLGLIALSAALLSACATADKPSTAARTTVSAAVAQSTTWKNVPTQAVSAGGVASGLATHDIAITCVAGRLTDLKLCGAETVITNTGV